MPITVLPGSGQGLSPFIQALINKEQLAQEKERIKLAEKDFELRQTEAQASRQRQQDILEGAQLGAQLFAQQNPELAGQISNVSPSQLPSLLDTFAALRTSMAGAATGESGARIAGVEAAVAERTQEPVVTEVEAAAAEATARARAARVAANIAERTEDVQVGQVRANLADANLRNALQTQVLNGSDPANGARAMAVWVEAGGQLTFQQAAEAVGFTGETSIDPNLRFQGAAGDLSADQVRAATFLPLMREQHNRIQQLGRGDFDGDGTPEMQPIRMTLKSGLQQASRSGILDLFINNVQDPEQRALVQANRSFADFYRFSLSGQQSSDAERLAMMLSITEQTGDDSAVIAQKARLRGVMINVMVARQQGTITALQAAQQTLVAAQGLADDEAIASFQGAVDAVTRDLEQGTQVSDLPGSLTFGNTAAAVDSIIGRNR